MQVATPGAQAVIGRAQTAIHDSGDGVVVIAGRRYFKPEYLAEILGKSLRTLARWHEQRIGPPRIKVGNQPLYDEAKLPAWLAEHESKPLRRRRSTGDVA